MDDLSPRMGASVGAARSDDFQFLAGCPANSFCQCAVNGSLFTLRGEPAKIGSVVSDG